MFEKKAGEGGDEERLCAETKEKGECEEHGT